MFGVALTGFGWFFMGRNDLAEVRADLNGVNRDFQEVQRISDQLRDQSNGFAGDIAVIEDTSRRIENRSNGIDERLYIAGGDLGIASVKVDELEQFNRELVWIGRDIGSLSFDLRQLSEESRNAE